MTLARLKPETPKAAHGALLVPLRQLPSVALSISAEDLGGQLAALASLTNLTRLSLTMMQSVDASQLVHLKPLTQLTSLSLHGLNTTSLAFLSTMDALTHLKVRAARQLVNLQGLSACSGLQVLGLEELSAFSSLAGIEACTELKMLSVEADMKSVSARLSSLKPLAGCAQLEQIKLYRQAISSLRGLENKTKLKQVMLKKSHKGFTGLAGLRGCTQLRSLTITTPYNYSAKGLSLSHRASFQSLKGLEACTQLAELVLDGAHPLADITALSACTQLQNLQLPQTNLTTLDALRACTALTSLDVSGSRSLTDISGIGDCTALQTLDISRCPTNIVDELQKLSKLERVQMSSRPRDHTRLLCQPGFDIVPPSEWLSSRSEVAAMQERMQLLVALEAQDHDTVAACAALTELSLYGSTHLTNPALLQLLTNLTRLDLRKCTGLPVKSWRKHHNTPEKVAVLLHKLAKKYPL